MGVLVLAMMVCFYHRRLILDDGLQYLYHDVHTRFKRLRRHKPNNFQQTVQHFDAVELASGVGAVR